jgi:hypothetical protein
VIAFYASVLATVLMIGGAFFVLNRRPVGTPLTWGEAFVGATYVWAILLLCYAIVPHQYIAYCDKDLGWRSDIFGIPTGPLWHIPIWPISGHHLLWAKGVTFMGHGRLLVNEQTVRDIVVSNIYIVFLVLHVKLWIKAQERGQKGADVVPTSPYGRPLVRKA